MYVQKMFKVFLPGEVMTSQVLKQWDECSSSLIPKKEIEQLAKAYGIKT